MDRNQELLPRRSVEQRDAATSASADDQLLERVRALRGADGNHSPWACVRGGRRRRLPGGDRPTRRLRPGSAPSSGRRVLPRVRRRLPLDRRRDHVAPRARWKWLRQPDRLALADRQERGAPAPGDGARRTADGAGGARPDPRPPPAPAPHAPPPPAPPPPPPRTTRPRAPGGPPPGGGPRRP